MERYAMRKIDKVIAVSQFVTDTVKNALGHPHKGNLQCGCVKSGGQVSGFGELFWLLVGE